MFGMRVKTLFALAWAMELFAGCQAIPLVASTSANSYDPKRQAEDQQRSLNAALADFPYTSEERSECSNDYETALMFADSPPDAAQRYVGRFKGCVEQRRQRAEEQRARVAAQNAKRVAEEDKKAKQAEERHLAEARNIQLDDAAEKIANDPNTAQVLLSVLLCAALDERAGQVAAIAKDKKYSQIGGAIDLRRRVDLQDQLAETDEGISALRGALRERKRQPLSCKDKRVGIADSCLYDESDDSDACRSTHELMSRAAQLLDPRPTD